MVLCYILVLPMGVQFNEFKGHPTKGLLLHCILASFAYGCTVQYISGHPTKGLLLQYILVLPMGVQFKN